MIIQHEIRRPDYYAASHWFQGAVFLTIAGSLAFGAIVAVRKAGVEAERLIVELTVRNMKTGMQLAIGEALMRGRELEIADWVGANPVEWLGFPPKDYRGVCPKPADSYPPEGAWCFDPVSKELLYRRHANGESELIAVEESSCVLLGWRVVRAANESMKGGPVGLRLEPSRPCVWRVGDS